MTEKNICPKCQSKQTVKSGILNERQRFKCKQCNYHFTVRKFGKQIDPYYVIKALQLHIEGLSYREIERVLGVSHVSVINWVKQYGIKKPMLTDYYPTYKIMRHEELADFAKKRENFTKSGLLITELGDKFMLIKWNRFKT